MGREEMVERCNILKQFSPVIGDLDRPLVSIAVYNYNYGRYLEECLESIAAQSYTNIEVLFSDNDSTDDSWEVAQAISEKYPGLMTLTKNRQNMGPGANLENCMFNARGIYTVTMCSDDALKPEFIERCLEAFDKEPKLGYVMVHRDIIDANSAKTSEPPFYNQSCIIKSEDQAAVYMMAAVNPSLTQIMYDRLKLHSTQVNIGSSAASHGHYARLQDFKLSTQYPMAYIKEPLILNRIHDLNDANFSADNLLEVIGPYLMNIQFAEIARPLNMKKVYERLPESIEKLSLLSLRYCLRFISSGDVVTAKRYFYLAPALSLNIMEHELFQKLQTYWDGDNASKESFTQSLTGSLNTVARTVSYDPPLGSKSLY